jgi:hypothetical protein
LSVWAQPLSVSPSLQPVERSGLSVLPLAVPAARMESLLAVPVSPSVALAQWESV